MDVDFMLHDFPGGLSLQCSLVQLLMRSIGCTTPISASEDRR
jgi:hypothetical protein